MPHLCIVSFRRRVFAMADRREALRQARLLNSKPDKVRAPLFRHPFFNRDDKLQVKYEMLRSHEVDDQPIAQAAAMFGYSRQGFYQIQDAFQEEGMAGLLEKKRGRKGPDKVTPEVVAYLLASKQADPNLTGAELAERLSRERGIKLHRRSVEKVLSGLGPRRGKKKRRPA
jgi:transposase